MPDETLRQKADFIDSFKEIRLNSEATLEQMKTLEGHVAEIVRENNALLIENQHLRDRIEELEKGKQESADEPEMSRSRLNLEKLYEDGFHVCNLFYGSRRTDDEPCAFCIEVIYGERR